MMRQVPEADAAAGVAALITQVADAHATGISCKHTFEAGAFTPPGHTPTPDMHACCCGRHTYLRQTAPALSPPDIA